jgi:hypothetical protein
MRGCGFASSQILVPACVDKCKKLSEKTTKRIEESEAVFKRYAEKIGDSSGLDVT